MSDFPTMLATPVQIKAGRIFLGWTAKDFAERLDVDRVTVGRLESSGAVSRSLRERATRVLQDAGIIFIARDATGGDGVRLAEPRATTIPVEPPSS